MGAAFALIASADSSDPVLLGDQNVETGLDSNAAGWAEAFPFTGTTTGSAQSITVYVDSHNRAGTLIAGLYSDNNGHPGTLLASGTKTSPASAAWNTVGIASTAVTSGAKYWVTLLGKGGALYFRDRPNGTCRSESSAQTSLSALPSTWKTGPTWVTCPVSAYVSGTAGSSSTSSSGSTLPPSGSGGSPTGLLAPSNTARPTVSGNITQGQTLTTTDGAWSNVPTSYAYAWQDCDTAGNSCTTISGATTSSYTLTAADAGHTIRSVVTARNLLGSGTASSDPTVTVVPLPPATTAAPSVSGTATQGQTLTTSNGSWSNNPTGYAYAWQDCDSSGASCANIMGATSSSLTLTANDVGHTIRSVVTASNAGGSARATSNATAAVTAPAPPPAPANTAAPTISGTAQQGNTITTSNGSWSGSPTSFSYQWQDCNTSGASCTNISGATSSSHVLQGTDVGSTIRAVVTATNTSGSASASSAPTAAVTSNSGGGGGLPSGVTLQQLDGGPNYYSKFSNAVGWDSPNFYPIAVFNQSLGYNNGAYDASQITAYKNAGVNGFVGLYSGYNQALLNAIKSNNMWVIDGPLAPSYAGNPMNGYVWSDEADGNNRCGDVPSASVLGENVSCSPTSDGRTPASVMSQVTADLHGAHGTGDATRFVYGQYTKPVARNEGLTPSQASTYVNAVDVVSFDDYIINDGWESDHNLWEQADLVRNVRVEGNYNHPVMPFIEAGQPFTPDQWSGIRATPAMSVAEAWNAIIGGARGIQWFDHDFGGSTGGYANSGNDLIDPNPVFASLQAAVKSFNNEVTALAPVLNSLFANGYVTNTGAMNVMAKYDSSGKDFYVFAAPRSNSSQSIKFTVAGGYAGPVMVYGENRTLTATNGQFTDNFADQTAVHIYVIPNS